MDNVRLFLFLALAFTGMLLYQSWQEDYGPGPAPAATEQSSSSAPSAVPDTPSVVPTAPAATCRNHARRPS